MRKELRISPSIVSFDNLSEIISVLEDYTSIHVEAIERYRERLGLLLRQRESKNGAGQGADPAASLEQLQAPDQSGGNASRKKEPNKRKGEKERDWEDQQGWLVFEADDYTLKVANQGGAASVAATEVSVLFKMVEALNSKVMNLKTCARMVSELPSRGIRADQRFLVIFRDGLPKQVIPTGESASSRPKFKYQEIFELEPLESV